jgi:hypothetical protein
MHLLPIQMRANAKPDSAGRTTLRSNVALFFAGSTWITLSSSFAASQKI